MEIRTTPRRRPTLVRDASGKPTKIRGYAAVYYNGEEGTEYELFRYRGERLVERLLPGCFDRAVAEDDVRALFNHDPSQILGRTAAGTCRLAVDSVGLRYEIDPPDTQTARDLMESMERGDITSSSFSFEYEDTSDRDIKQPDGSMVHVLEVRAVKLYDVSPVTFPAYKSTTAEARAQYRRAGGSRDAAGKRALAERVERDLAALTRSAKPLSRRERVAARGRAVVAQLNIDDMLANMKRDLDKIDRGRRKALRRI
jgi:HK97 family phage prohead protease